MHGKVAIGGTTFECIIWSLVDAPYNVGQILIKGDRQSIRVNLRSVSTKRLYDTDQMVWSIYDIDYM